MTDSTTDNLALQQHSPNADDSPGSNGTAVPAIHPSTRRGDARLVKAAAKRHAELTDLLGRPADEVKEPDFVHDVRVGARRLGEVARLLAGGRGFMDKPSAKAVDASLKGLRRSMGDLRDSDVTREHLLKWRMPAPVKKVAREIAERLHGQRNKLEEAAREQLNAASLTGAMVLLARIFEEGSKPDARGETEKLVKSALTRQIKKREKQLRRSFGKAASKQTAESLHAARITVKKLRYQMELAEDAGTDKGIKKKVRFLKQIQELLGDHHDVHVIALQIEKHLNDAHQSPIKGLAPAWRKWKHEMDRAQARRAAEFFAKSYAWINEER